MKLGPALQRQCPHHLVGLGHLQANRTRARAHLVMALAAGVGMLALAAAARARAARAHAVAARPAADEVAEQVVLLALGRWRRPRLARVGRVPQLLGDERLV